MKTYFYKLGLVGFFFIVLMLSISKFIIPRYKIGIDEQAWQRCLPFQIYIEDHYIKDSEEFDYGDLVVIKSREHKPSIEKDSKIIKILAGKPGDAVRIESDMLFINSQFVGRLFLNKTLKKKKGAFDRSFIVPKKEWFVIGTSPGSFDSRYWGTIKFNEIKGKGYAIF